MRISNLRKKIMVVLVCMLSVLNLSGCTLIFEKLQGKSEKETITKLFDFEGYNTLEIIVSENEKFILYLPEDGESIYKEDDAPWHRGYGEWIKDGVAIPILFSEDYQGGFWASKDAYDYRGFEIGYDDERAEFFDCAQYIPSEQNYIAMLVNDSDKPILKWWVEGKYGYNVKWSEGEAITYSTYNRNTTDKWTYVSDEWWSYISVDESENVIYSCEEGNFFYHTGTDSGSWVVNEKTVSIRIEFDPERLIMKIYDISNGNCILTATGYVQDEHTVIFNEYSGSMFYRNSIEKLVVKKSQVMEHSSR